MVDYLNVQTLKNSKVRPLQRYIKQSLRDVQSELRYSYLSHWPLFQLVFLSLVVVLRWK